MWEVTWEPGMEPSLWDLGMGVRVSLGLSWLALCYFNMARTT